MHETWLKTRKHDDFRYFRDKLRPKGGICPHCKMKETDHHPYECPEKHLSKLIIRKTEKGWQVLGMAVLKEHLVNKIDTLDKDKLNSLHMDYYEVHRTHKEVPNESDPTRWVNFTEKLHIDARPISEDHPVPTGYSVFVALAILA